MRSSASISWPIFVGLVFLGGCGGVILKSASQDGAGGATDFTSVDLNFDGTTTDQVADDQMSVVYVYNVSATEYVRQVVIDLGAHFLPANICSGKTIFGRVGEAACMALIDSRFRDKGTSTTRLIPVVASDTDGHSDANVDEVDHSSLDACGLTQATVEDRIDDCVIVNDTEATWSSASESNSGHGDWKLVSKTLDGAVGKEVWRDERTGLLWSDSLSYLNGSGVPTGLSARGTFGWCFASGNIENAGGLDCRVAQAGSRNRAAVSLCAEDVSLLTPNGVHSESADTSSNTIVTWGNEATAVIDAKGGMKLAATVTSPSVEWRLPSREDYFLAYANGMSYVLPRFRNYNWWTSSVDSLSSTFAWYFSSLSTGDVTVSAFDRIMAISTRCVG